jgi:cell migration-inducing and hyaluronan-binding protein
MPSPHAFLRALLIIFSVVMLAACGRSITSEDGHDMHASCFRLVTGQDIASGLTGFISGDVENPVPSPAPPRPVRRWSEAAGWPGGKLPAAGDAVTIPAGDIVLLDTSPPELASLVIAGALVFDRQDLELAAGSIELRGGLYIGSAAEPFTQRAVITVGTEEHGKESDCFGRNYLGLVDGTLEIYGNDDGPAWTRLAATAAAGATSITVDDPAGWRAGDRVAIASTDFYSGSTVNGESSDLHIEQRTVTGVSGSTLHFAEPLQYRHFGQDQEFGSGSGLPATLLESRAEVMRLTRNVTIRGHGTTADEASGSYRFGAHIMALGNSRLRLDSVELTAMGQAGRVMRYPVHFHLMGNAAYGSFVRNSSLHHLYNRCITIHGSSGVLLQDNAAFDTFGHCYFFEDGAETGNVLRGNFGMMARAPREEQRIIRTDGGHMGPAVFWITNPDKVLVDDVAGS